MSVGIICEYNPFHNGHLHHLSETGKAFAGEAVICLMSGSLVQRGDIALLDKSARARMAVLGGADLVLELPLAAACASARDFARGGVGVLKRLSVTHISFGSECGETEPLVRAAKLLDDDGFDRKIKELLRTGLPFALARQRAFDELAPELAPLLRSPNNLLGIEYIRASKGDPAPFTVLRRGAPHDGTDGDDASASAIRASLREGGESPLSSMPDFAREIYLEEVREGRAPVFIGNAERAVLSRMRRMSAADLLSYADTGEGLNERIVNAVSASVSLNEVYDRAKTKRYAHSRIRRIVARAYFGVTADTPIDPPYVRILAFNGRGRALLKSMRKDGLKLITRPSDIRRLSPDAARLGELEAKVTDLYSLFMPSVVPCGSEWRRTPVYVG